MDQTALLEPITPEQPSGESLRYEGTYDLIQDARREDDASLDQGVWQTELKRADWAEVERACTEALVGKTKDLQIAVWLLEAWMNRRGHEGLREGLDLVLAISERFWETMYPEIQPDDLDYRLSPIEWMNTKLPLKVRQLAITNPRGFDAISYALSDIDKARNLENLSRRNPDVLREINESTPTVTGFQNSMMLTPDEFLQAMVSEADLAVSTLIKFEAFLDERCGNESPSLRHLRDALTATAQQGREALKDRGASEVAASSGNTATTEETMATRNEDPFAGIDLPGISAEAVAIRSRSDAYTLLSRAADYLIRTEPHSPAPYLVRRAVAWGNMPLAQLLQELMDGGSDLGTIYRLLGMTNDK